MRYMNLIILGPPGSGKGTQADLLARKLKVPHISTGDMFREIIKDNVSRVAKEVRGYVEKGELVPDSVVLEMVKERLKHKDTEKGFILDGFPRTLDQAQGLVNLLNQISRTIELVLYLEASTDVILERLSGRRICLHCNANYHIKYSPPQEDGVCDRCAGELYQREDDKEETIKRRLEVYLEQAQKINDFYKENGSLFKVSGDLAAKDVLKIVEEKLAQMDIKNG